MCFHELAVLSSVCAQFCQVKVVGNCQAAVQVFVSLIAVIILPPLMFDATKHRLANQQLYFPLGRNSLLLHCGSCARWFV